MEMGELIKNLRIKKGLTQEELGNLLGLKKAAINKYENGTVENIKRSIIQKMAEIFGVSPAYLMGWEDEKKENKSTFNPNIITKKDEKSIQKDLKKIMDDFKSGKDGPAFYNGVELDEEELELIEQAMELALRSAKIKNKAKYTPKKYRKDE